MEPSKEESQKKHGTFKSGGLDQQLSFWKDGSERNQVWDFYESFKYATFSLDIKFVFM
jgi:hypothetical protein